MTVAGRRIGRVGCTVASRDVLQSWVSSHARAGRQRPLCEQLGHVRHASGGAALAGLLPRARSPAGERSVRMFWAVIATTGRRDLDVVEAAERSWWAFPRSVETSL